MKTYEITVTFPDGFRIIKEVSAVDVLSAIQRTVVPLNASDIKSLTVTEVKP